MFIVGDGTPVGDAWDDRLRAQETLQPSTDRRGVVGVVGPATRVTAARRGVPSCARPAPRDSS